MKIQLYSKEDQKAIVIKALNHLLRKMRSALRVGNGCSDLVNIRHDSFEEVIALLRKRIKFHSEK